MPGDSPQHRVAISPAEFAKLFGKSTTWGYREIYAGRVKTITQHGRILIPSKEVERILASAAVYEGRPTTPAVRARQKEAARNRQNAWRQFVQARRTTSGSKLGAQGLSDESTLRKTALARLVKRPEATGKAAVKRRP